MTLPTPQLEADFARILGQIPKPVDPGDASTPKHETKRTGAMPVPEFPKKGGSEL